jgi:hypothetical protein
MPLLVPLLVLSAAVLVLEWVSISDSVANSMKSKRWTAERSTTMPQSEIRARALALARAQRSGARARMGIHFG